MIRLIIYSRPGCHLCDEMKALVTRHQPVFGFSLEEIDISTDPALEAQYGLEIPVLLIDGKKMAKYRMTEGELQRMLAARKPGPGGLDD